MSNKMIGKIKWFDKNKGYGYINGYDEEIYYFEISNLLIEPIYLQNNREVKFIPKTLTNIFYADEIELYQNENN